MAKFAHILSILDDVAAAVESSDRRLATEADCVAYAMRVLAKRTSKVVAVLDDVADSLERRGSPLSAKVDRFASALK